MRQDNTMSTEEVAAYAGITLRQMYHWVNNGWVYPARAPITKQGRRPALRWTERDAARVVLHNRLMQAGLTGDAAAVALRESTRGGWISDYVKVTVKP